MKTTEEDRLRRVALAAKRLSLLALPASPELEALRIALAELEAYYQGGVS